VRLRSSFIFNLTLSAKRTFLASEEAVKQDVELFARIEQLRFITTEHLSLKPQLADMNIWSAAQEGSMLVTLKL